MRSTSFMQRGGDDMKCNVGGTERSFRIGAGLLALGIGLFAGLSSAIAGATLVVGAILMLTGAVGFCPLFTVLGINTCSPGSAEKR
jgi:hypothetical protein